VALYSAVCLAFQFEDPFTADYIFGSNGRDKRPSFVLEESIEFCLYGSPPLWNGDGSFEETCGFSQSTILY